MKQKKLEQYFMLIHQNMEMVGPPHRVSRVLCKQIAIEVCI